jgi:hypothetical protein
MLPGAFDPLASGLLAPNPKNLLRERGTRRGKKSARSRK